LNVYEIDDNPFQPRRDFSEPEIASLAESLKEHDMLQPILVRKRGDRYQLISGERRLRAAIQAGWSTVPARVREADDRLVAELAIVENLQRKDLNPLEKAMSFKRYLEQHGCSQEDLARRLKIDRSTIANLMRLLELPDVVQDAIRRGALSAGHARALLPLGDESLQVEFCTRILAEGLSVRAVEGLVQDRIVQEDGPALEAADTATAKKRRTRSGQVSSLEQELRLALGTRVEIRQASRGRGRIVIHFGSEEEFDRLRSVLTDGGHARTERRVA
jgi:ParB family chromosome partitioning protein